jgi:hypothetical protein
MTASAEGCHQQPFTRSDAAPWFAPRNSDLKKSICHVRTYHVRIQRSAASTLSAAPRTAKSHYIRSMIAFSVALGLIAAQHLSSSGK